MRTTASAASIIARWQPTPVTLAITIGVGALTDRLLFVWVAGTVGMLLMRGASVVCSALWQGARSEVVDFGADTAFSMLTALRKRLKISGRESP